LQQELREGEVGGHPGAGDGGGAGAAVGLQHVAVEGQRAVREGGEVEGGAQAAADQALDLGGAAGGLSLVDLARAAGVRGPRQHGVLGGQPAAAAVLHERRHPVVDARRHQDAGLAELDEHRAFGEFESARLQAERAEGVDGTAAGSAGG